MKTSFTFQVDGRMPGLNDYIKANRGSRGKFFGNGMKKFLTDEVEKLLTSIGDEMPRFTKPVVVVFEWKEMNMKRDPDNVAFAKKFILDGMVKAGMIENDGWKQIAGFADTWEVRPDTDGGVIVTVTEQY